MSHSKEKPWDKPWTTEEIIENANNWSLAGDAAVLKTLEAFADKLFEKVEQTNDNLNSLLDNATNANIRLNIARNKFRSLHNTQFIESRVYEDDETVIQGEPNEKNEEEEVKEEQTNGDMKEAILKGLQVIDEFYDRVEVEVSDSEEDDDFTNIVLRPKDPYINRKLPHVIGTDEWYKKWHVGLKESSSESESDKTSEKFSDTDSETDLPIPVRSKLAGISETSSEAELKLNVDNPVANSTFNDTTKHTEVFGSSGSEESSSIPIKAPISSNNFAEQLAAKLGNVINQQIPQERQEINTKPIQNVNKSASKFAGLFDDEPPPLDDEDEELFNDKTQLFSGGTGLFDDDEDEQDSLWNRKDKITGTSAVTKEKPIENKKTTVESKPFTSKGIFDDDDDIDDLFNPISKTEPNKSFLPSTSGSKVPLFDNEPPELDVSQEKKSKPTGGVSLFGDASYKISDSLKKYVQNNSENEQSETTPKEIPQNKPKKVSLFDDDDDTLFEDDLFSNISTKKFTSGLFDDSPPKSDIFTPDTKANLTTNDIEDTLSINSQKISIVSQQETTEPEKTPSNDLFKNEDTVDNIVQKPAIAEPPKVNIFDPAPPPDSNDWETKDESSNVFDDNIFSYETNYSEQQRTSMFENEPPSLVSSESGIGRDRSSRGEGDVSSFYPGLSSSRRLSSDIFNEQQSNDSLFVTKNKTDSSSVPPFLHSIPEMHNQSSDTMSVLDITPSGDASALFGDSTLNKSGFYDEKDEVEGFSGKKVGLFEEYDFEDEDDLFKEKKIELRFEKEAETKEVPTTVNKTTEKVPEIPKPKTNSPGKLKHNLNINVSALIPGAMPPRKDLVKSQSLDDETYKQQRNPITPEVRSGSSKAYASDELQTTPSTPVNLEKPPGVVETLHSLTKDRAKISVKRRPSTRKGRQELIRKSSGDFVFDSANKNEVSTEKSVENVEKEEKVQEDVKKETSEKLFNDSLLFNGDDEFEDLFSNSAKVVKAEKNTSVSSIPTQSNESSQSDNKKPPALQEITATASNVTKPATLSTKSEKTISLFDSPDSEDDDLFKTDLPPKSVLNPTQVSKVVTGSLFDNDDGLFGSRKPAVVKSDNFASPAFESDLFDDDNDSNDIFSTKKLPLKSNLLKKSLFDDDEDDIFSGNSSSSNSAVASKAPVVKNASKTSTVRRLDATEMSEDPLSALQK